MLKSNRNDSRRLDVLLDGARRAALLYAVNIVSLALSARVNQFMDFFCACIVRLLRELFADLVLHAQS